MYIPLELTPLFNVFLVVLLILFILTGYRKGLLLQLLDFFGLIVSLFIAWMFSPALGASFGFIPKEFSPFQETILADYFYVQINSVAWFIILFFAVSLLVFLLKPIVKTIGQIPLLKQLNGAFGILFSMVKLLIVSVLVIFILSTPLFKNGGQIVDRTWLRFINSITVNTIDFVGKPILENKTLQAFILNPKQATPEDIATIVDWLKENGIEESKINQFLIEVGK